MIHRFPRTLHKMPFIEKFAQHVPTLSYEIFPPKNPLEWAALYDTLGRISKLAPDFISVTYRGGVSTTARTVELVGRIQRELEIETVAHLTCITHTQDQIAEILKGLTNAGVRNIIALRGDLPKRQAMAEFKHATDLIQLAKGAYDFNIACAFYPEKHPDSVDIYEDIQFLKLKQDCGATFAISQFFFDNDFYYRFRDAAVAAGISIPLIAGIMPVNNLGQLRHFKELSGTDISAKLVSFLGDDDSVVDRGIEYGAQQCEDLLNNEVAGIHLFTLNKSKSTFQIGKRLIQSFPQLTSKAVQPG